MKKLNRILVLVMLLGALGKLNATHGAEEILTAAQDKTLAKYSLTDTDLDKLENPFSERLPPKPLPPPKLDPATNTNGQTKLPTLPPKDQAPATPKEKIKNIKLPNFSINGIVWNSDQPQAIVNNQVVSVGQKISEATITNITEKGVEVLFEGRKFRILYNK